jgi:alanine racemase
VSSTGALLDLPDLRLAMVRCGLGVYGYYPSMEVNHEIRLQPVLALRSRIARVATLAPGDSVGYSRSWFARGPSRLALVMAGYADGLRRGLSGRGEVAMDMFMLDITDVPEAEVDDQVTLIGRDGDAEIDADEVAELSETISYETLAGIMARVPRLYLRGGRVVGRQDYGVYQDV